MIPSRAKEVLEGMGLDYFNSTMLSRHKEIVAANTADKRVGLNGRFTREELQAIALWMQDPESVVNA